MDGRDDFLIGATAEFTGTGTAYLFLGSSLSGNSSLSLSQANFKFEGTSLGDTFGRSISGIGDVTGNSFLDILIGSNANGAGTVALFSACD